MQPASGHSSPCGPTPVPDKLSSSFSSDGSSLCISRSNDSTCGLVVPPGAAACKPPIGIVASQGAHIGLESVAATGSVSGPFRVCGKERAGAGPSSPPPDLSCPNIPDSCSEAETIYSIQGYETGMSLHVLHNGKHFLRFLAPAIMVYNMFYVMQHKSFLFSSFSRVLSEHGV